MIALVGMEVSEYFSCPILITEGPSHTSLGFSPSVLTMSYLPSRKLRMVLFPTPVSPITITASWASSSLGMAVIPFLMSSLSLARLMVCSDIVKNIIIAVSLKLVLKLSSNDFSVPFFVIRYVFPEKEPVGQHFTEKMTNIFLKLY